MVSAKLSKSDRERLIRCINRISKVLKKEYKVNSKGVNIDKIREEVMNV